MGRASDGGIGSRIRIHPIPKEEKETPWSIATYPRPDPSLMPDPNRRMDTSPVRLFWRNTGVLAYGPNKPHPVDEESELVTWEELNNPTPRRRSRGRPRKNPNDPKWQAKDGES
jgi:hypothetical protein